jgi:hypothetical protein
MADATCESIENGSPWKEIMRIHSNTTITGAVLITLFTLSAFARDHNALNGTWTLVPATSDFARQSGDTQGLSGVAEAGSESVEELVEEGQSFEAEVISGMEDAPDPDVTEVHTKEVPEDDVPSQYLGRD